MRRIGRVGRLLAGGVVLVGVVAALAAWAQEAQGLIPADAKYVTSKVCGMCHKDQTKLWQATLHSKQQPPEGCTDPWRYTTGWNRETKAPAEAGVACEACHGRGGAHMKASAEERKSLIVTGAELPTPAQQVSICAQCHGRYTVAEGEPPADFTPGDDLLAKVTLLPVEEGQKMQQVNELVGSKHWEAGAKGPVCFTCHAAHGADTAEHQLRRPILEMCADCHLPEAADMATHSKGKAKEGDTCATCHMPGGSHAFQKPAP